MSQTGAITRNGHLLVTGHLICIVLPDLVAVALLPAPVDHQVVHLVNQALFSVRAHLEQSKFESYPVNRTLPMCKIMVAALIPDTDGSIFLFLGKN